jgi:hypothetical protein
MKIPRAILTTVLGSSLVLGAHAGFAASSSSGGHVPAGQTIRVNVILQEAALCDGSVRLEAGPHVAEIRSLGDGSVKAAFLTPGRPPCNASGKIVGVVVEGGLQPGAANAVVVEGGKQPGAANSVVVEGGKQPSFASFGFTPQSQVSFQKQGNSLSVIVKGRGSNQIFIRFKLPAVQAQQAPGGSKIKN